MASGGYLVPPAGDVGRSRLWDETWKRLERFLPSLYGELFAEPRVLPGTLGSATEAGPARDEGSESGEQVAKG